MIRDNLKPWFIALLVAWTVITFYFVVSEHYMIRGMMEDMARNEARALISKDLQYRFWAARHGGVYAPVTADNQPNNDLNVQEREITTPSGKLLTLINPAYMNRQVFNQSQSINGVRSKITSEKTLRSENRPDEWELGALKRLNAQVDEYGEVAQIEGKPHYRFIKRLVADEPCLKCHEKQGYKKGDVRGGLSLAVNLESWYRRADQYSHSVILIHLVIWLMGLGGLFWGYKSLATRNKERDEAEKKIFESRERFRITFECAGVGIVHLGIDNKFVEVNKVFAEMLGYEPSELTGKCFAEITHPDDLQVNLDYLALVSNGSVQKQNFEKRYISKSGKEVLTSVVTSVVTDQAGTPQYFIGVVQDITEKRYFENELARNQKMESLGVLAGGVGHDFNNLMTIIMGFVDLIVLRVGDSEKIRSMVEAINSAIQRATNLSRQLMAFSKGGETKKSIFDLNSIVKEFSRLALSGRGVDGHFNLDINLKKIEADEDQISQIVMNLLINACQAMNDSGKLVVTTKSIFITDDQILKDGDYVMLKIRDSGPGIRQEDMDKIFDPFFTTKPNGRGLGLATVYLIVRRYGGKITVTSKLGSGTTFKVYLPATNKETEFEKLARQDKSIRKLNVLVMDDEVLICNMAVAMLQAMGHQAVYVLDGEAALKVYAQSMASGCKYDLVIMDLTIKGGMGGEATIAKLLEIDPSAVVIVASGYNESAILANHKNYGFKAALPKPFKLLEFKKCLSDLF